MSIRKATRDDAKRVIDLIIGLAKFERLTPPDAKAKARLQRDMFDKKLINVLVAQRGKTLVGYALYFFTYSSFLARPTLYLEDIFVREEERKGGVGKALFLRCVRAAVQCKCGRMEWQVLTWNKKAILFYRKLGAEKLEEYRQFRLDSQTLGKLSRHSAQ